MRRALLACLVLAALAAAACGPRGGAAPAAPSPAGERAAATSSATGGTAGTIERPSGSPTTGPSPAPSGTAVAAVPRTGDPRPVTLVAVSDRTWQRPTEAGPYPSATGGATGLFVAEQDGVLYEVAANGAVSAILDLRDRVLRSGNEEGLLSIALDPGFATNRFVWVYYSMGSPRRSILARFTRQAGSAVIDRASQLVVLEVNQPFANHNGGAIRFGPDGMLYLGLGDGGSAGDPQGNGQNLATLLGKIIRIDVRNSTADRPYAVPSDNPFLGQAGARGEIWAYGFRNPWRTAFDPATGALWVGDVGQGDVEEVDVAVRGGNFGWSRTEGDRCYKPATGCDRTGLTPPVAVYNHEAGRCSIVGGFVYRGTRVPEITGAYVYGDTCSGEIWAIDAAAPKSPVRIATGVRNMTSFALDADGELMALAFGQPIRRLASPR